MFSLIWLYPISFLLLILWTKNKKRKPAYTVLLLYYFLSSCTSVYVYEFIPDAYGVLYNLSLIAIAYHIIITIFIILSYSGIDNITRNGIPIVRDNGAFQIFTWIIIIVGVLSVYTSSLNVNMSNVMTDGSVLREALTDHHRFDSYFNYLISYLGGKFFPCALALAFYYVIKKPEKKLIIILLFLASLTSVVEGLNVAAREYIVKYAFCTVILFVVCYQHMSKAWRRSLSIAGVTFVVFGTVVVFMISLNRFGLGVEDQHNTIESIFVYLGQGFINFSTFFKDFISPRIDVGSITFPFFAMSETTSMDLNSKISASYYLNVFSTSLGSWMIDGGIIFATIIALIYGFLVRWILKGKFNIYRLCYLMWFIDYAFSYIFFFNDVFKSSRIFTILIVVAFDVVESSNKRKKQFGLKQSIFN